MQDRPTKTFGISSAMDVWIKIKSDFERLKAARYTREQQYAALDCAIWSYHLIDWVLNEVSPAERVRLTAKQVERGGLIDRFIATNADRLPTLSFCRQIANTSKHRVLTKSSDDPEWTTGHSVRIEPPFDARDPNGPYTFSAVTYFRNVEGQEMSAVDFFDAVVRQWEHFLQAEKLYHWGWDYEPPGDAGSGGEAVDLDR